VVEVWIVHIKTPEGPSQPIGMLTPTTRSNSIINLTPYQHLNKLNVLHH
jgi:hypothetical protein